MIRKTIKIDEEKCTGCGLCVQACHEGAIGLIDGKAKLLREDYCDGLGDCLPACPENAISFEEREAAAYSQQAVIENKEKVEIHNHAGCPGSASRILMRNSAANPAPTHANCAESQLAQWPVQIKLTPTSAPYFEGAKLLIAADCTAYAYANFHQHFMHGHVTLVGCPKLDMVDYSEKLSEIIGRNNIKSVTIVRMEVPCCGGLENAVKVALQSSGKFIPWQVVTISTDGRILE